MKKTQPSRSPLDRAIDKFGHHAAQRSGSEIDRKRKSRNLSAWRRKIKELAVASAANHELTEVFDFGGKTHRCDRITLALVTVIDATPGESRAEIMQAVIGLAIEAGRCEISGDAVEVGA